MLAVTALYGLCLEATSTRETSNELCFGMVALSKIENIVDFSHLRFRQTGELTQGTFEQRLL